MISIDPAARNALLRATVKATVVIGFLSLLAANYLATGFDQTALSRLAADVSRGKEPTTTGTLASLKLDPCAAKPTR